MVSMAWDIARDNHILQSQLIQLSKQSLTNFDFSSIQFDVAVVLRNGSLDVEPRYPRRGIKSKYEKKNISMAISSPPHSGKYSESK